MDDDLKNLEAELARLRPADVSTPLLARIEREIALNDVTRNARAGIACLPPARRRKARVASALTRWLGWATFPVAAAVAVVIWRAGRHPATPAVPLESAMVAAASPAPRIAAEPGNSALKPIRVENVLVEASDEGLVTLADGTRARRERLHYVDTIVWKNARTNASLTWSVPREEVRVVPVVFQ